MKVSRLRQRLQAMVSGTSLGQLEQDNFNLLIAALAKYDALEVEAALKMFQLLPLRRSAPKPPILVENPQADELKRLMFDDTAFENALDRVAANKKVTKAALLGVYQNLFGSLSGVPTKSTRDELLDLIRRERVIVARNAKSRMPGRRA